MTNTRSISPIAYSAVIAIALWTGMGIGLLNAFSHIPANNPVVDTIFFVVGPVLTVPIAHFLMTGLFSRMKRGQEIRFLLLQAFCGLIFASGTLWFVSTFREMLSTGGFLNLARTGSLVGLWGVLLGFLAGWTPWGWSERELKFATVIGWGLGAAACGLMIAYVDMLLYAGGY